MSTYSAKPSEVKHTWYVIDANGLVLGRMAAEIAKILRGKHKPTYTPHIDTGDYVIVINADKVKITGKKADDRVYYKHTGHPGGIKETTATKILEGKNPSRVIELAVKRMLKRNNMGRHYMTKLRIFVGPEHTHAPQNPVILDLAARNKKNKRVA